MFGYNRCISSLKYKLDFKVYIQATLYFLLHVFWKETKWTKTISCTIYPLLRHLVSLKTIINGFIQCNAFAFCAIISFIFRVLGIWRIGSWEQYFLADDSFESCFIKHIDSANRVRDVLPSLPTCGSFNVVEDVSTMKMTSHLYSSPLFYFTTFM